VKHVKQLCPYVRAGERWRCPQCGAECRARSDRPPTRHCPAALDPAVQKAIQTRATVPCAHRGEVVRYEACRSCCGKVEIKVFGCALFGECTIGAEVGKLPMCVACDRYQAARKENRPTSSL
jgi:hypothetical protein